MAIADSFIAFRHTPLATSLLSPVDIFEIFHTIAAQYGALDLAYLPFDKSLFENSEKWLNMRWNQVSQLPLLVFDLQSVREVTETSTTFWFDESYTIRGQLLPSSKT